MKKKLLFVKLAIILIFLLAGCTGENNPEKEEPKDEQAQANVLDKEFEQILEDAKGTTVAFTVMVVTKRQMHGLTTITDRVKKDYDITVERVGMNIDEVLNIMLNEKQLNVEDGTVDVVWINGENFFTAMKNDLLFGPFTEKLPNFNTYIDKESPDVQFDFGYPVNGYEAPYGKAQVVMIYNSDHIDKTPVDHKELLELAKANPGKITYPAPPDFTGSAFVRNIISDIVGYEQFMDMEADEDVVREAIAPAIEYFKELKPYLWKEGVTYPGESALLDNMFADGEVWMAVSYNPNSPQGRLKQVSFLNQQEHLYSIKGQLEIHIS